MTDSPDNSATLLQMALHGCETDWDRLHYLCLNRATAEKLAQMLEQIHGPACDEVWAWAQALEEMHPGLKVVLRP